MNSLKLVFRLSLAVVMVIVATAASDRPAAAVMTNWGMCAPQQSGPAICGISCPGACECDGNPACTDL